MDGSDRASIRIERELQAEFEELLRIELERGRKKSVAAFIRLAVRGFGYEVKQRAKPEFKL